MLRSLSLSTLLLSASVLASPLSKPSGDPLPLIIWHGLGDNYAADGLAEVASLAEEVNPGTYIYMIRLDEDASSDRTATFLGNVTEQISSVCTAIAADPILSSAPGVNALGFKCSKKLKKCSSTWILKIVLS